MISIPRSPSGTSRTAAITRFVFSWRRAPNSSALFASIAAMERAVTSLRVNCVEGITANAEHTQEMVLNSLGIVTVLKPSLGYKQCAEIAHEGHETGKSLHDIVVKERKLLTQQKWDEVFSFENLINPKFEQ